MNKKTFANKLFSSWNAWSFMISIFNLFFVVNLIIYIFYPPLLFCLKVSQDAALLVYSQVTQITIRKCNYFNFIFYWGGGAHRILMWHLTRWGLYHCFMQDHARRCRTSTVKMASKIFWRNSYPFKKKEHFSS